MFSKKTLPAWFLAIISTAAFVVTMVTGGSTSEIYKGKNGSEYRVDLVMPSGIIDLIEKCDLKKTGDRCPVSISVTAEMIKEPSAVITPEDPAKQTQPSPVKPEESKASEAVPVNN